MASERLVPIPEQHVETLRLAHQRLKEAEALYQGVASLVVDAMLHLPELADVVPTGKMVLDVRYMVVRIPLPETTAEAPKENA